MILTSNIRIYLELPGKFGTKAKVLELCLCGDMGYSFNEKKTCITYISFLIFNDRKMSFRKLVRDNLVLDYGHYIYLEVEIMDG